MEAILYKALLLKEFFFGLLFKGAAGLVVYIESGQIPKNWIYLALIIILIFPAGTYILEKIRKYRREGPGWAFLIISMIKMMLLPALIFLFFDKEHDDIEAFVMPSVIAYLIMLGLDTKWKIKWLFGRRPRF